MFGRKKEAKRLLKKLPFYKTPIEKPYTKRLRNIDMLRELPLYDELNILKMSKAFQGYGHSYSVKEIDSKDPSVQLAISKPSIKDFFQD